VLRRVLHKYWLLNVISRCSQRRKITERKVYKSFHPMLYNQCSKIFSVCSVKPRCSQRRKKTDRKFPQFNSLWTTTPAPKIDLKQNFSPWFTYKNFSNMFHTLVVCSGPDGRPAGAGSAPAGQSHPSSSKHVYLYILLHARFSCILWMPHIPTHTSTGRLHQRTGGLHCCALRALRALLCTFLRPPMHGLRNKFSMSWNRIMQRIVRCMGA
jgi:hypothetical protein